jgi:ABC-2 type transport system ATP-binding protein
VERLADRVVMLESGRVTVDLPLAEFAGRAGYAAVVAMRIRGKAPDVHGLLPANASVDSCVATGEGVELTLRLRTWGEGVFTQLGALLDGSDVVDVQVRPARLEEAFASFVGTGSPDAPA